VRSYAACRTPPARAPHPGSEPCGERDQGGGGQGGLRAGPQRALASRATKQGVAYLLGQRGRNSFYPPFYLAQSVVTFGVLVAYIRRLPDRELYN
jgi:hypothetical protein